MSVTITAPTLSNIRRETGIAGQYAVRVEVKYDGEPARTVRFFANTYGGPVVMVTNGIGEVVVNRDVVERLGAEVNHAWVRAFFAPHAPWN